MRHVLRALAEEGLALADRHEHAALVRERVNPTELREPGLEPPVVDGRREELRRFVGDQRTRVRADVLDAVLAEPALHLAERMAVLLGMLILVAQPRSASRRLVRPIDQDRVERNTSIPGQPGD